MAVFQQLQKNYQLINKPKMTTKTTYRPTQSKGIYKTPSGTYRFRKMKNGVRLSFYFPKYLQAVNFKKELNSI